MSDEFNLDAGLFMKVRRAVGTEETRYYLHGVRVEPIEGGGAMMIATDGRVMMVAEDPKGIAPRSATINLTLPETPPADCSDCDEDGCALQGWDYSASRLTFSVAENAPAVAQFNLGESTFRLAIAEEVGGNYPDWRKAALSTDTIKTRKGHMAFGINPELLHRVSGDDLVSLEGCGDAAPIHILFNGHDNMFGVIMPCDLTGISASKALLDEIKSAEASQ